MRDFVNDILVGSLATPDYAFHLAGLRQAGRVAVHSELIELSGVMEEYPYNSDLQAWKEVLIDLDSELAKTSPIPGVYSRVSAINLLSLSETLYPCETDEEATRASSGPISAGTCYFNTVEYEIRSWANGEWVTLGIVDSDIPTELISKKHDPFKTCQTFKDFKVLVFGGGDDEDDDW